MYTDGIKVNLTEEEIKEAIDWGIKNKDSLKSIILPYCFGKLGLYEESGMIFTKTCFLAQVGFDMATKYENLDKTRLEKVLKSDTLPIMVTTYGRKENFLRGWRIVLKQGKKIIRPKKTTRKEEAGPTVGFLSMPYSTGYISGYFPYSEINLKAESTILVYKGLVESRFAVDFSRYK